MEGFVIYVPVPALALGFVSGVIVILVLKSLVPLLSY